MKLTSILQTLKFVSLFLIVIPLTSCDFITVFHTKDEFFDYSYQDSTLTGDPDLTPTGSAAVTPLPVITPAFTEDFNDGNDDGWTTYGGNWSVVNQEYIETTEGDGVKSIADGTLFSDFILDADVKVSAGANAGLLFRAQNPMVGLNAVYGYFVFIDSTNSWVTLGRMGNEWQDLFYPIPVKTIPADVFHHLRVIADGPKITYFVNNMDYPVLEFTDPYPYLAGAIGVRTFQTSCAFDNITVRSLKENVFSDSYQENFDTPGLLDWVEYGGGTWTKSNGVYRAEDALGIKALASGVLFENFTMEADLKIASDSGSSPNAGFVFRANNPAGGDDQLRGYYAGIYPKTDHVELVKLNYNWNLADYQQASDDLLIDTVYHIKVEADGAVIKVFIDDMINPVINFTDYGTRFSFGSIGFRVSETAAEFDNLVVTSLP